MHRRTAALHTQRIRDRPAPPATSRRRLLRHAVEVLNVSHVGVDDQQTVLRIPRVITLSAAEVLAEPLHRLALELHAGAADEMHPNSHAPELSRAYEL